jgi:hypothetical protein
LRFSYGPWHGLACTLSDASPEQVAKHVDEHDASLVTSRLQVIGEVCEPNFVLRVGECHLPAGTVMPEGRIAQEGTRV